MQFTGGSTYIISLPKSWIEQNQVKKGSFIKIRAGEGGLLTIDPSTAITEKKSDEASIIIRQNDEADMVTRKIVAAYLAGYNSIKVASEKHQLTSKQRQEIKTFVRRMFVGTEIVTDSANQLVLQVLLNYPELTIQSALRRMSIIATSMHKDAILGLKTNDKQLAKEIISADNEVDRFNLYVIRLLRIAIQNPRIIKEIGIVDGNDCLGYRIVTKSIERAADHAVNIPRNALALKNDLTPDVSEKIEQMSTLATEMFDSSIDSLFRQNYSSAESIIENIKEVTELERKVVSSHVDAEDDIFLRLIIESIRRTAEYAADIAEVVLNMSVESILV